MIESKEKRIINFLQEKPGYIKKSPILVLNKISNTWNLKDLETAKRIQRNFRLKAKGFDDIDIQNINNPRRLFLDIETSPDVVYSWNIGHKVNIPYDNIIMERAVICVAWKWEHSGETHCIEWEHGNDKKVLQTISKVISECDEIIGHNLAEYDVKFLRGRALYHNINFPAKLNVTDTYKKCKELFRLNSNRLDYIGRYLMTGSKSHTEFQMWKDIVENNQNYRSSLNKMKEYCKNDVNILQDIYHRIKKYLPEKKYKWIKVKD